MQTSYRVNTEKAIAGLVAGTSWRSRPGMIPKNQQVTTITFTAGNATTDVTLTITDDETGQVYTVVGTGSATEATMLDNLLAASRAHAGANALFVVAEDGSAVFTMVARHAGRAYTITCTGGSTDTTAPAVATTVSSGATGLRHGIMVARGTNEGTIAEVGASTVVGDLYGATIRTDGNHFQDIPAAANDLTPVGKDLSIMEEGYVWMLVEETVARGDTLYMRRAQTSSAGILGALRKSPAGSVMTATLTPVADLLTYSLEFDYLGRHYSAVYSPTDGTTAVGDAIDGIVAALGTISGLTITDNTTNFTIATAAGTVLENLRSNGASLDADTISITISAAGTPDADAIDVSSIARVELGGTGTVAAPGLALIKLRMQP